MGIALTQSKSCQHQAEQTQKQTILEQQDKVARDNCQQHTADVIHTALSLAADKQFTPALVLLMPCETLHNTDIDEATNKVRELDALNTLSFTSPDNVATRKQMYVNLVRLVPTNLTYKAKLDYYTKRYAEQEAKDAKAKALIAAQLADTSARFGPQPDNVTGKVAAELYVERNANDPDSIQFVGCTPSVPTKEGWLIKCQYRGKNPFGGLMLVSNMFLIVHGNVVKQF